MGSRDIDLDPPRIGVLAMQGAFAEHVRMLQACGVDGFEVRTPAELECAEALVLPGGESTAIRMALDRAALLGPMQARVEGGMPAFGTCAGMIVLADTGPDGSPPCFGALDIDVERNGFGSQVHSFEADVRVDGAATIHGVFIRAPRISRIGEAVDVVGRIAGGEHDGEPVVVAQGPLLAASFHPELTADDTLHRHFIELVRETRADSGTSPRS